MRAIKYCIGLVVLLGTLAGLPSRAEAGIPFLITHGDSITNLAPVPADRREAMKKATGADVEIGYAYSYFGLFWLDIWTWGGKYCLYHDKEYWELKPDQAAALLGVAENKLPKPLSYSYPPLLVLILVVVVLFGLIGIFVKTDEQKAELLRKDPRYGEALEIFDKRYEAAIAQLETALGPRAGGAVQNPEAAAAPAFVQPSDEAVAAAQATMREQIKDGLQAGIDHLVAKGIKNDEAAENLALLVRVKNATKDGASAQPEATAAV